MKRGGWPVWPVWLLTAALGLGLVQSWNKRLEAANVLTAMDSVRQRMEDKIALLSKRPPCRPLPSLTVSVERFMSMNAEAKVLGIRAMTVLKKKTDRGIQVNLAIVTPKIGIPGLIQAYRFIRYVLDMLPLDEVQITSRGSRITLQALLRGPL